MKRLDCFLFCVAIYLYKIKVPLEIWVQLTDIACRTVNYKMTIELEGRDVQ